MAPTATVSKPWNIGLWVLQTLLALSFLGAGVMKTTQPIADLAVKMDWVTHFSEPMVRFVGASEFLGGLGLLLPSILRIKPILTPIAAALLALLMFGAFGSHIVVMKDAAEHGAPSLVLALLSALVAWGRFTKAPIAPKA